MNKIQSHSVPDWNVKITLDDGCDDTLENDEAVTEVTGNIQHLIFILGRSTHFGSEGSKSSEISDQLMRGKSGHRPNKFLNKF